jgi:sulfur carrier protein ThiS
MEQIQITLFAEGEKIMLEIPPGTKVGDLVNYARTLQGQGTAAYRVNGQPTIEETPLKAGDRVTAVPTGGQLA